MYFLTSCAPVCDEKPFSILETGTRIAFFWSRVRDENENFFLSFSCFETRTRISFSQSRASRREREFLFSISDIETRTRIEIETILARIFGNYIYCLFIDRYFQKKTVIFSKFIKIICLFFSRNLNKNLIFRDENGKFFSTSRVTRREREFLYSNLVFREGDEKLNLISQGRAGKNEADSHGNSREREFPSLSDWNLSLFEYLFLFWKKRHLRIEIDVP